MAVTVEELEIVIEAKIQEALNGLETVQKKLMETATKVAPQFNKQMQAAMSGLASNLVQPIEKAQQQMKSAMEQTQAVTKKQSDAIIQQQKDIASQIQHTTKELKKQSQAISKAVSVENNVEKPLKVPETPASKTGNDNQRHLYDMTHAAGAVADSVGRTFQLMEGMKQASGEVAGIVANNLENVSKKIQTQGALLTQLQQKFAQTVNSNGISPKALQAQMKILNAEDDMRKLVEQYNKIIERAEKTADVVKRTAQTMGDSYDMLIEKDAKRQEQMFKGSGYDRFPDEPAKPSKLASQILRDDTTADSAAQAQAAAMQRASQAVQQSIDRVQKALESMRQVSAQATGAVAANLENINQKMQAQQALLDQLQEKLARAMASEGMSEKTVRVQKQLLGAENAMRKLVDQYNKAAESAEEAADSTEEIKDKAGGAERSAKKLPNPFLQAARATKSIQSGIEKASASTKKFQQTAKTVTTKVEGFFQKLGRAIMAALPFLALAQAFRKFTSFIGEGIKSAIDAPEIENMFAVALGNMAAEADAFAKQFKKSLGVDEYATKQMIGTFNNMIATMGIGQQTAYKMSKTLTILANDMASLYNVAPEQAFENLQSAMSGQSEAVRKYGYILNETTIKQVALRHGIIQEGQTFNENQKVLARYLALMEQSTAAQGDMARTSGSLANQLRILKSQLEATKRALGEAFIPILETIVPIINAFLILLERLGHSLAKFTYSLFGRDYDAEKKKQQDAIKDAANITGGLEDVADAEKDVGKEADKTKKKVQNMLAPFDELYVIQQKMDEEKTPENPNVPNLEWDVPTLEVPDGESPLEQLADRIMDKLRDIFKVFRQAWENEGQNTIDAAKYAFESLLEAIKAVGHSFSEVWNNGTGQEFVENILRLMQTILNIIGDIASAFTIAWEKAGAGTALIQQIFDAANAVLELVISIGKAFREAWNDGRGVEIWDAILSIATNVFAIVENLADRLRTAWEQNDNGVKIWGHILDIVQDVLDFLDRITEATANWATQLDFGPLVGSFENLLGVIEQLVDSILNGLGWAYENVLLPFGTWLIQTAAPAFLDAVAAVLGSSVWQDAARSIKDLYENSLKPLAQWTGEKIMDFLNWIKNNGDAAAKIIIAIGEAFLVWLGIKGINKIATDVLKLAKTIKNCGIVKLVGSIGDAFKKLQPAASKATQGVISAFKKMAGPLKQAASTAFAAMQISGNPFTGLMAGLESAGRSVGQFLQNLSPLAKIGGTLAGVTAEFAIVSNAVEKFASGSQGMGETLLKVIPTIGAVGAALTAMLGPIGLVVTALAGVVAGIKGWDDAVSENNKVLANAIFYDDAGIKVSELADAFHAVADEVIKANEPFLKISESIDKGKQSISNTSTEISSLITAVQMGAYSIKEKLPEIQLAFQKMYDDTSKVLDDTYNAIIRALSGSVGDALQQLGTSLPRATSAVSSAIASAKGELKGYQEEIDQIFEKIANGTATDQDYKRLDELNQSIARLTTEADKNITSFKTTMGDFETALEQAKQTGVGFEEDGSVIRALESIQESAGKAKDSITDSFNELQGHLDTAKGFVPENSENWNILVQIQKANEINRQQNISAIDSQVRSAIDVVDESLTGRIKKMAQTQETQIGDSWKTIMAALSGESLPEDRPTTAAIEKRLEKEFAEPIRNKLEAMKKSLSPQAAAVFAELPAGGAKGISDNVGVVTEAVNNLTGQGFESNSGIIGQTKKNLGVSSPSKVFAEIGKFLIEGLANGINENAELVKQAITDITETVKTTLQKALAPIEDDTGGNSNGPFYEFGAKLIQGLAQGISESTQLITDTLNQTAEAINTSFKELFQIEDYSMVFYNYGMGFMQGLAQGVTEGIEIVREAFLAVGEAINTALNEALAVLGGEMGEESSQGQNAGSGNGNVFYQFGAKLMMGLSQGITDTLPVVLETITVISTSIIDAFKQAFLIDEFSQVFFDFGVLLMQSLADGITEGMALVQEQMEALAELITQLYTDFIAEFSETLSNDMESINQIASDQMDEMVNIVSQAVDEAAKEISSLISKINSAISKARELQSIASSVGGYSSGRNARRSVSYAADIPQFASGAVLRSPTVGLMAEYPGAASNPEIVTPQNILQETFIESLFPLVSSFHQDIMYLADVVRENGVEINGDAEGIFNIVKKEAEKFNIMTGGQAFSAY